MSAELTHLSDDELLQRFWIERNPLATTALESLLAERFQEHIALSAEYDAHIEAIDEHEATAEQVVEALQLRADFPEARALLDVLKDFDFDDATHLRAQLDRLKQFDEALAGLREPLQSLTNLATTE